MQCSYHETGLLAAIIRHSKASIFCPALEWFAEFGFLCTY